MASARPTRFARALSLVEGDYAITVLFADHPDMLVAANHGHPLSIGQANLTACVATDPDAIAPLTQHLIALQPGEIAELRADGIRLLDSTGRRIGRQDAKPTPTPPQPLKRPDVSRIHRVGQLDLIAGDLGDGPATIGRTLHALLPEEMPFSPPRIDRVLVLYEPPFRQAAMLTRPWWRNHARVRCAALSLAHVRERLASARPIDSRTLIVGLLDGDRPTNNDRESAKSRFADAVARLDPRQQAQLAVVAQAPEIGRRWIGGDGDCARRRCMIWPHHAGQERGLAATKSVLGAMTTLAVMALKTGLGREVLSATRCHRLVEALLAAQAVSTEMLDRSDAMQAAAACLADASTHGQGAREHAIHVIGDKAELPLAEEGADKIAQIAEKRALALEAARMDLALRTGQITPAPTVLVDMTGRAPATTPSLMARLAANPLVTLSPARPQDAQIPARLHGAAARLSTGKPPLAGGGGAAWSGPGDRASMRNGIEATAHLHRPGCRRAPRW